MHKADMWKVGERNKKCRYNSVWRCLKWCMWGYNPGFLYVVMGYELTVASQNTRAHGYKKSVKIATPKLIAVKKADTALELSWVE